MDKLSLLPCPFCGSSKIEFRDIAQQTLVAVCCGCNAEGGYTTLAAGSTSRDEAAEFWNTRSDGLPPPGGGGGGDNGLSQSQPCTKGTPAPSNAHAEPSAATGRGSRSEALAHFEAFVKRKDEMDRMGYGLRAEEWPEFVATMRAALTIEGCGETYRNWNIRYAPPPIPTRGCDWQFAHDDFDGAPDANDSRCGCAESLEAAKAEIDAWIEENFDCRCSAAIPQDCMALTCKWRAL